MSDTPVNPFDDAEEIAKKSMVLFFLIDCSGSMGGSKIGTVNSVMEELIPEIRGIGGADADIKLAVLKFSGGCEWMYDEPISIDEFEWKPLDAENVTDLGSALTELAAKLSRNEFMKSTLTFVRGSGWHSGMSSLVRLVAMMPAMRATPSTSPFFTVPLCTAAKASAFMVIMPWAVASRVVTGFALTSTITALPAASKCVRLLSFIFFHLSKAFPSGELAKPKGFD